jgi:hypothetical protein
MANDNSSRNGRIPRLRDELTRAQETFCETTLKRFRVHLLAYASQRGVQLDQRFVDDNSSRFYRKLKDIQVDSYLAKLFTLRRSVSAHQGENESPEPIIQAANAITADFATQVSEAFRTYLEAYFDQVCCEIGGNSLNEVILRFEREMLQRSSKQTMKIMELFGLEYAPQPEFEATSKGRSNEVPVSHIKDLFGRGLLYPLELYFAIADTDNIHYKLPDPVFPRSFCSPVLQTTSELLVGDKKYANINSRFTKLMVQNTGKTSGFSREDCNKMFGLENVRLYLMGYMLNNLKVLLNSSLRDRYIVNINTAFPDSIKALASQPFSAQHYDMLCVAWARFLCDNYACIKAKRTAREVLSQYIPDLDRELVKVDAARGKRPSAAASGG